MSPHARAWLVLAAGLAALANAVLVRAGPTQHRYWPSKAFPGSGDFVILGRNEVLYRLLPRQGPTAASPRHVHRAPRRQGAPQRKGHDSATVEVD